MESVPDENADSTEGAVSVRCEISGGTEMYATILLIGRINKAAVDPPNPFSCSLVVDSPLLAFAEAKNQR